MEPISKTWLKIELEFSLINAYGISKIIEITICKKRRENKFLNQLLKKVSVDCVDKLKNANGDMINKTSIKIYLYAKLISNVREEIDNIPLKMPSIENKSNVEIGELFKMEIKLLIEIS